MRPRHLPQATETLFILTSFERLWTDYERLNQTHFWSETAKVWWTSKNDSQFMSYGDEYTYFDDQVVIDGYEKLKNIHATNGASCICVGSCLLITLANLCETLLIGRGPTLFNRFPYRHCPHENSRIVDTRRSS